MRVPLNPGVNAVRRMFVDDVDKPAEVVVIHLLPGEGKTLLSRNWPKHFTDGDLLYKTHLGTHKAFEVLEHDELIRRSILQSCPTPYVLTADVECADIVFLPDDPAQYFERFLAVGQERGLTHLESARFSLWCYTRALDYVDSVKKAVRMATY